MNDSKKGFVYYYIITIYLIIRRKISNILPDELVAVMVRHVWNTDEHLAYFLALNDSKFTMLMV